MKVPAIVKRICKPVLESRKVRVALATVLAAVVAEFGFHVSEALMTTILGIGAALILGIAHEDNGEKHAAGRMAAAGVLDPEIIEAEPVEA